ncbi:hypothetical protein [Methylobacterium marchantiae]|uniref:Uncharacterized protein n=1 Tax=Methylobacterium marchantiae TaxID=600331 RepID=A0ABW3X094_9HYPH|nr:hypothetical protein AIGOOFII_1182 [Methylobacterium marchantiae]
MRFRFLLAVAITAPIALSFVNPAFAKDPAAASSTAPAAAAKEPTVSQSAARERQKKCGAEWRALSVADKAAQGPKWPQYFSKCVKRLKEIKA